ncbi:bifunctional diaminohydroxyphosphoribosylaminopyrimidine deaminase/5-amino-6-(5-phosphoribosylamino)uracil reductase RibD [Synechococcus sp. W2B2]|uniref:bifunctional diaminohydroxyphosphoribosylaminopyrimidine deaminase/5-amino-6-(5-phosphoribosylamino)uracil reductase RibD n=1 Tax=unclassified Synechococcus TaxID=2626047 RepID=UPI00006BD73A|nr:bifunctional diaminohydroxyphosphoribosylaminopyrimidine deaminase/5-amino-6-(5-phosphoribosylamino)uracil reductase RibD [Synechococcus sp. WH 7805]EAR18177.1 riboflavin biosynthesis protein RibD [Synechococcus sp. WH 7805]
MRAVADADQRWIPWMRRALELAALADGYTSPNPLVGAVVLDPSGTLVGEGFHARAGEPHAEVGALAQAGDAARGGTIIVTLEPCCHHGRTPPCTDALIKAGIARVVVALTDPDPRVAGGGLQRLRDAGVEVISGVLEAEAAQQNYAFVHRVRTGRPWGLLKWAMSLDGRTALPNGASQWISGSTARTWVHRLRAQCDAVIVGGGTVRADDPLLTSRGLRSPEPLRVVLSRRLDLPDQAQIWDQSVAPTLVVHGQDAPAEARDRLEALGLQREVLPACGPESLMAVLAQRGCNRVLWECGPELAAAALQQACVQELAAVIAPKLLGGEPARTPLGHLGFQAMEEVVVLQGLRQQRLTDDLLLQVTLSSLSDPC